MATNRELRETAEALAQEVGVSVSVDGLGRKKLEELIESLEARKAPAPEETTSPEASEAPEAANQSAVVEALTGDAIQKSPPAEAQQAQAPGPARYVVGPRISFSCGPRGFLRPGDEVRPDDFDTPDRFYEQVVAGKIRKV